MKKKIFLTFDLDYWHNSEFLKKYLPKNKNQLEDFVKESTESILNLLNQYNQRATFFVLGEIAEKYPKLIKRIHQSGHEIASHGYSHTILSELGKESFEKEIKKTNKVIKETIGQDPIGFRAPNFSLDNKTRWAFKVLEKHGLQYDSSIYPFSFTSFCLPSFRKVLNVSSVTELMPSLGGFYFRVLPLWLYLALVKLISRTSPPIIFIHPHELFKSAPKIEPAPWFLKKVKYWGTKSALDKFEKLLKKFKCISIKEYLNENSTN